MRYSQYLFGHAGVHAVCDGQYGSTGKGALAAFLAQEALDQDVQFSGVVTNAGPNSGHTFYWENTKIVLKQLPTFGVYLALARCPITVYLSGGAIIDPDILRKEAAQFPNLPIIVHPNAAVIRQEDKDAEHSGTIAAVAGTRSGTGYALARKVMRDPDAVWGDQGDRRFNMPDNVMTSFVNVSPQSKRVFMEVSQGFSLGINQRFYPKCTSRECTVAQGMADAGFPARSIAKTYMAIRTFPIRVGNVDGHSSGDWYNDQREVTWDVLKQKPELTTVTQRVRRVATFSAQQLVDALRANSPDFVFVNFMNYLSEDEREDFKLHVYSVVAGVVASDFVGPVKFLYGNGPLVSDVS